MRILFALLLFLGEQCFAQSFGHYDEYVEIEKSEAPYFYTGDSDASLPLVNTSTDISIDSVIADIHIKQSYKNESSEPIEAVYTFPASSKAAVYGLTIKVEDRVITAVVKEKNAARRTYEKAKQVGKSAALLEQDKPNLFTMHVANILPGDIIEVDLHYTELLKTENNIYEFTYPLSINPSNPNYAGKTSSPSDLTIHLNTAIPSHSITSPSHPIDIIPNSPTSASIHVTSEGLKQKGDFVLRFQLAGESIQTGIQLAQGEDENYFLLQMEPPARLEASMVPNREYIFVIDISGSMRGFPIEISKTLIAELLKSLHVWEKFNLVLFSGGSNLLSEHSLEASPDNIDKAIAMLEELEGSGGTNLLQALKQTGEIPLSKGYSRNIITITDGYIHVESEIFNYIDKHSSNANYFAFGIGNGVNRYLMEVIARAGYGEAYIALNKKEGRSIGKKMINTIRYPVLSQIDVNFGEFDVYDLQPIALPDLYSNKPITISGKWRGTPQGSITLSGINGIGEWQSELPLSSHSLVESRALEYIWARKEIQTLQDFLHIDGSDSDIQRNIIDLGIKHNLLTKFTSLVAVDHVIRTSGQPTQTLNANGYTIPALLLNIAATAALPEKETKTTTITVGEFEFDLINNEWIDKKHAAHIPVIEIPFNSELYHILVNTLPELTWFKASDVIYINFGELTVRITSKVEQTSISTTI